jgi:hypothetical protein
MDRRVLPIFLAGALAASAPALAQQNIPGKDIPLAPPGLEVPADAPADKSPAGILDRITRHDSLAAAQGEAVVRQAIPAPVTPWAGTKLDSLVLHDSATVAELLRTERDLCRFRSANYSYTMRVYEWQQLSSQIIFSLVVLLVLAGLYFSWLQFQDDLRHRDLVDRLRADLRRAPASAPAGTAGTAGDARAAPPGEGKDAGPAAQDEVPAQHHVKLGTSGIEVSSSVLGIVILVLSLGFFYLYLVYVYPITEVK